MSLPTSPTDPFGRDTSGSTSFRLTTYDMVKEAYTYCGIALDTEGEDLTPGYLSEGKRSLNTMVATWQAQGIHLWTYTEGFLFLEPGVNSYTLEQVRATNRYLETTTTSDITAGGSTVDLASVSEITTDYWLGVMGEDNNLVWNQVLTATTPTITIDGTFPDDIASGATVYYYESQIKGCERVLDVRRISLVGTNNETPIKFDSHQGFFRLPDKATQGSVSEATYDRTLAEGVLYIWATPANSTEQIRFTYERKLEDFINNDDCPDFPKYWMEALTFNLAKRLAAKYNVPAVRKQDIYAMAEETLDQALSFDDATYDIDISINGSTR
jgi:hypothetical protein